MSKNRDGKPTAFQVAAIKKAGLTLKGIKTYRDAENALKRVKRAEKKSKLRGEVEGSGEAKSKLRGEVEGEKVKESKGVDFMKKAAKVKVTVDPKRKPGSRCHAAQRGAAGTVEKKPVKQVAGVGVFRVRLDKADVIEALMVGFAKSILAVFERK